MGRFWDVLTIVAITVWLLPLVVVGLIPVELAVMGLLGLVAILAIGRKSGGPLGHLVRLTLRVALPVASLFAFLTIQTGGSASEMLAALGPIMVIVTVAFGFYIMFSGLSGGRRG